LKISFPFFIRQFWEFGLINAKSCVFAVLMFSILGISKLYSFDLPRYDFILICCILFQLFLYLNKYESKNEVKVVFIFHFAGLLLELFKVQIGSWSYPEFAYSKVLMVPLYSGFMYSCVASYMLNAWKKFDIKISNWPSKYISWSLGFSIYFNFFTNHFIPDLRYFISVFIVLFFYKTKVGFKIHNVQYQMPLLLSFVLIGIFIWFAENIATFLGAWKYSYQHLSWKMVKYHKISSWILLVIFSFVIIAENKINKLNVSYLYN
jgi:uncharacterized membrane protein YoaT (DUF817 family)